ncbi:MAG: IS1634 family transposase, partial [Woeseiaceae bacterium]|nr:IS1634 family transposase [Woeseiaceae bacterium]
MYITRVPNRNSPPAILLRESYRDKGKVKSRTLANLSKLPLDTIEVLRRALNGEQLVAPSEAFEVIASRHHGHVHAVLLAMRRLGFAGLIASRASRARDVVVAMVAARLLEPDSKLATTRWWHITSLPDILGVADADENELYDALDWLLERQQRIERKLATRHLANDALALYDLSSSYFEGVTCPLAAFGHNRDGKKGKLQVNYGVLTNSHGLPVAVSVFEGNTGDPTTLVSQLSKVRDQFGLKRFVLVGDRGMITQKQVDVLRDIDGVDWIAALRPGAINTLLDSGALQMDLFDERNLFELTHPDFPGERLVACRNPELAKR